MVPFVWRGYPEESQMYRVRIIEVIVKDEEHTA